MKLINVTKRIDDATFEPLHTLTIEVDASLPFDMLCIERGFGAKELEAILGMRMREILIEASLLPQPTTD